MPKRNNDFDRNTSWYIFDAYLIYTVDAHNTIFYFQFGFQYVSYVSISIWRGFCPKVPHFRALY